MADKLITSISIDKNALKKLDKLCITDRRVRGDEIAILIEQEVERREAEKSAVIAALPEAA